NMNVDPSSQSGQAWNVFMNQVAFPVDSSGTITGQAPATTLVKVSPHPMHYNDICLQGTGCITSQGNRNLADFFTVTIDKSGAANVPGLDVLGSTTALSSDGRTLTISTKVADLGSPAATAARVPGAVYLEYVTRWQMGNTIYYAGMATTATNQPSFYAGKAQSVDLCSVSACFPHVITYPESNVGGTVERGA